MNLRTTNAILNKADKNITVYKIAVKSTENGKPYYYSPYYSFTIEFNKEIKIKDTYSGIFCYQDINSAKKILFNMLKRVSFFNKDLIIIKGIIPKGTAYWKSMENNSIIETMGIIYKKIC